MKTINISFDDKEFKELSDKRKDMTWKEFILLLRSWEDNPTLKGGN